MNLNSIFATASVLLALASSASGQAVTFTGDAALDFASSPAPISDPGGIDVGMPPLLLGNTSGWDIDAVFLSYDAGTDTMFVGIDTFGIAGDADGDGDPGGTSAALSASGGTDEADLGGTEAFTFGLDLNNDGTLDVLAGVPFGADYTGFTVAEFSGSIFSPSLSFGTPLPGNTGALFANPSAGAPDLEFTITNFSVLMDTYAQPQQMDIGVHAFLGSFSDDGIGEDAIPGNFTQPVPTSSFRCLPVENLYLAAEFMPVAGGDQLVTTYGVPEFYGCCVMIAGELQPVPMPILDLPGAPVLLVGKLDGSDLTVLDVGAPSGPGAPIQCKETTWFMPDSIASGTTFYSQVLAYPGLLADPLAPWLLSNVVQVSKP